MSSFDSCGDSCDEKIPTSLKEETQPKYIHSECLATMRHAMEISDEQQARDNTRFVKKLNESNASNKALVEEIYHLHNLRRTYPLPMDYN